MLSDQQNFWPKETGLQVSSNNVAKQRPRGVQSVPLQSTMELSAFAELNGAERSSTHLNEVAPIVDGHQLVMDMHNWHPVVAFLTLRDLSFAISIKWLAQSLHKGARPCK